MKNLELLSTSEKESLLKFPAYISLLAANNDDSLNEVEKKEAIKFCHIKTYSCDPLLSDFYAAAEKVFEKNITTLDTALPKEKHEREKKIKKDLVHIESILLKLEPRYAAVMHQSMESFKKHVSRAHHNVLEYFLFPLPIKGLTD